jgi:hypothetical protein
VSGLARRFTRETHRQFLQNRILISTEIKMTLAITNEEAQNLLSMKDCLSALELAYKELAEELLLIGPVPISTQTRPSLNKPSGSRAWRALFLVWSYRSSSEFRHRHWPIIEGKQRQIKVMAAPGNTPMRLHHAFKNDRGTSGNYPRQFMFSGCESGRPMGWQQSIWQERTRRGRPNRLRWQGAQLLYMCAVRPLRSVKVYSPNAEHRFNLPEMAETLGIE